MLSALDAALEAATSGPRTAAFQPKVKPRARKGISGPVPQSKKVEKVDVGTQASRFVGPDLFSEIAAIPEIPLEIQSTLSSQPITQKNLSQESKDKDVSNKTSVRTSELPEAFERSYESETGPLIGQENVDQAENVANQPMRESILGSTAGKKRVHFQEPAGGFPERTNSMDVHNSNTKQGLISSGSGGLQMPVIDENFGRPVETANPNSSSKSIPGHPLRGRVDEPEKQTKPRPQLSHSTRRGRRPKRDFPAELLHLDSSQLSLKNIIRKAEAAEREKAREELLQKREEAENAEDLASQRAPPPGFSVAETVTPSLAPQVQVINGRIVINEGSLNVASNASAREDTGSYKRVDSASAPGLNTRSYANWTKAERWSKDDTDLFYQGLQQFGSDFALIGQLFPGRTRRQIKSKYMREDRLNKDKVDAALNYRCEDQSHYHNLMQKLVREGQSSKMGGNIGEPMGQDLNARLIPIEEDLMESGMDTQTDLFAQNGKAQEIGLGRNLSSNGGLEYEEHELSEGGFEGTDNVSEMLQDGIPQSEEDDHRRSSGSGPGTALGNPLGDYGVDHFGGDSEGYYSDMNDPLQSYSGMN